MNTENCYLDRRQMLVSQAVLRIPSTNPLQRDLIFRSLLAIGSGIQRVLNFLASADQVSFGLSELVPLFIVDAWKIAFLFAPTFIVTLRDLQDTLPCRSILGRG